MEILEDWVVVGTFVETNHGMCFVSSQIWFLTVVSVLHGGQCQFCMGQQYQFYVSASTCVACICSTSSVWMVPVFEGYNYLARHECYKAGLIV